MEQLPQDKAQDSRPVWAAWLSHGILLLAFFVHMVFAFNPGPKLLIALEGLPVFSVSVLTAITRKQMAEFFRRHYQRLSETSVFRAFYSPFGGKEVSLIHRLFAVNFVFVTAVWSMICLAAALGR